MGRSAPVKIPFVLRRGVVLGVWFFLLAVGSVGATILLWQWGFGTQPGQEQPRTEDSLKLHYAAEILESRLNLAEQLTSVLLSQLTERSGADRLRRSLQALDPTQIDALGVRAASYWPSSERRQALYMSWNQSQWQVEKTGALPAPEVLRRETWHVLSRSIGQSGRCLWSGPELEPLSRQRVISCSRVLPDASGEPAAIVRLSFQSGALLSAAFSPPGGAQSLIVDARTRVLASSDSRFAEARNIADVAKIDPELGEISVAFFRTQEEVLKQLVGRRDFPQAVVEELLQQQAVQGAAAARELVAMHLSHQLTRTTAEVRQICRGQWCTAALELQSAPWLIVQLRPAQDVWLSQASSMALGILPPLLILLLAFFVTTRTVLQPLKRLTGALAEPGMLSPGDLSRSDEFGQIARVLDKNAAESQSLRQRLGLFRPEQAAVMSQPHSAVNKLPTPALLVDPDGKILEISPTAHRLLGHGPGDMTDRLKFRSEEGDILSLERLPADLSRQKFSLIEMGGSDRAFLFSTARYHRNLLITIDTAASPGSALAHQPRASATASGTEDRALTPRQQIRRAIAQLKKPANWLVLYAEPEVTTSELAGAEAAQELADQVADRIDDRLKSGEGVIACWRNIYLVQSAVGLSGVRINEISEALKSALVFSDGERIRLKVRTRALEIQPGMRVEDLEADMHAAFASEESIDAPGKAPARRAVTRNLDALVQQGFAAHRFQLITERGDMPGAPESDWAVYRVLPHLEDEDGFWLDRHDFLPTVNRQGRRADLDNWLCQEVRGALQRLKPEKPVLVFLPVAASSLLAGDSKLVETLAEWTASPEFSRVQLVITVMATELQETDVDINRFKPICSGLRCELAIEECSLNSHSLMLLERAQPDYVIPQGELQRAAASNGSLAIGMESLLRVAARHKCKTVFAEVNSSDGLRLASTLKVQLVFGSAVSQASPMLFGNVA